MSKKIFSVFGGFKVTDNEGQLSFARPDMEMIVQKNEEGDTDHLTVCKCGKAKIIEDILIIEPPTSFGMSKFSPKQFQNHLCAIDGWEKTKYVLELSGDFGNSLYNADSGEDISPDEAKDILSKRNLLNEYESPIKPELNPEKTNVHAI